MCALVTALIAAMVLVGFKTEYGRLLMSEANYGLQALISRVAASKKSGENVEYDLYLGSSMFRQGLDIYELEEMEQEIDRQESAGAGTGTDVRREAYILSYNGSQPFLICKEVEYLLEHEVPIASVTVDLFVNSVQKEPWVEDTRLFLDTDLSFKRELWQEMKNREGASLSDLWEMLVTANNDKLFSWYADYPLVNRLFYNGGNLVENSGASEETLDGQLGSTNRNESVQYEMNERQVYYLQRLIDLCRDNDIAVCFVETPKYKTAVCEQAYVDVMVQYCQFLQDNMVEYYLSEATVQSLQDNLGIEDAADEVHTIPFDNTNPDYYIDVIHLSSEGRRAFTQAYVDLKENAER